MIGFRVLSAFLAFIASSVISGEFLSTDINTGLGGTTLTVGPDGFDVSGGGADIWNQSDGLRFHYKQFQGDFDISARVESVQNIDAWSKAGVQVRQSLAPNSVHAMAVVTPGNGFAFQYRNAEGGSSSHVSGGLSYFPYSWVRLIRIGQTVRGYKSVDPTADEWSFIGSTDLTTSDPVYVGLCVTAHNNSTLCKAMFRNVSLQAYVPPVSGTGDGLLAQYFNTSNLSGSTVLSRVDSEINFDWGNGAPDSLVSADKFSVRWSGRIQPQFNEQYTFYTESDDGIRVWVNGSLIIDFWGDHSRTENRSYPLALKAGVEYEIVVEFYENAGGAEARLLWSSRSTFKQIVPKSQLYSSGISMVPIGTGLGLKGEYFTGIEFGAKILTRVDSTVNFDWGSSEATPEVGADNFAVRWTGLIQPLYSGQYNFHTLSDDGVRLWIDNQLIIDNWTDHGSIENTGYVALTAGKKYAIRMEYYEKTGSAVVKLLWSSASQTKEIVPASQLYPGQGTGLFAEYFNNSDFTYPALSRVDSTVNFDWGYGSPDPTVAPDTFSVRWSGSVVPLYSESYTFFTVSDDGVRLWVNGQLVIDNWADHAATENASAAIQLNAGQPVNIKMEFYENGGLAVAKLLWSSATQVKQPVSTTQLEPNGGILASIPVASAVSPAFIEGKCWAPTGQPYSILGNDVKMLGATRFYTNLPLSANSATPITFSHSSSGVVQSGSVLWTPTNLTGNSLSTNSISLRTGDSLLLTATGNGASLSIDANGDGIADYTGAPGDRFGFTYTSPGTYTATAYINNIIAGTLLVNVVRVDLSSSIACELGFKREKQVVVTPAGNVGSVYFETADLDTLDVRLKTISTTNEADVYTLFLTPRKQSSSVLVARLGDGKGPVISSAELQVFTVTSSSRLTIEIDADNVAHPTVSISPYIPNLVAAFNMFASTCTFADGTTSFNANTNVFEQVLDETRNFGLYSFDIYVPVDEVHACFSRIFYQDGVRVSY